MSIGPYRIVRDLGQGGMAQVSLARSPSGRLVVLKRPIRDDRDLDARLFDEARAGQRIKHPNLVDTVDYFEEQGRPVLVVSYVPGMSLDRLLRFGKLSAPVVCRVGRQIASALHAMHTVNNEWGECLNMVHRDVSPSNIMLGHDGDACLIDLGIVRSMETMSQRTATGFLRGKLRYLAPELFDSKPYSALSDLWALGVVLTELSLGRSVFKGSCQQEVVGQIVSGKVLKLQNGESIEPGLLEVLRRLLTVSPDDRVQSAKAASLLFARLETRYGDTRQAAVASMPHPATAQMVSEPPEPKGSGAISLSSGSWDVLPSTVADRESFSGSSDLVLPWTSSVHELSPLDEISIGSGDVLGAIDETGIETGLPGFSNEAVVTLRDMASQEASRLPTGLLHEAPTGPTRAEREHMAELAASTKQRSYRVPPLPVTRNEGGQSPADLLLAYARQLRAFEVTGSAS